MLPMNGGAEAPRLDLARILMLSGNKGKGFSSVDIEGLLTGIGNQRRTTMYEFKRSLMALTGMLFLAGMATIAMSHSGRGTTATSSSAPASQTQNVNVVNTPTVNAQQSGSWSVGISGTPVVGLSADNNIVKVDTTNPLATRDVDNPSRQAFQHQFDNLFIANGNYAVQSTYSVPAGKRLVIQEVSLQCGLPTGDVPSVALYTKIQGVDGLEGAQLDLQFPKLRSFPNDDYFATTTPIVAYADGGTDVLVTLENQTGTGTAGVCSITLVGHFVGMP
jgi:hypothetical protein